MEYQIDARDMQPPEPFNAVMDKLDDLGPGDVIRLLLHIEPMPLFRVLERNGYTYTCERAADGLVTVLISPVADR